MVDALCEEIKLRKDYLPTKRLSTVYFGGGTPSLLNEEELGEIFETIHKYFEVEAEAEVTLEANPDDLTNERLKSLARTPVNRLSIGVQSFFDEDLKYMNRAHNADEAGQCILNAQDRGFENLSIDLIYGAPTTSDANWAANVDNLIRWEVRHLSCYALTVEPGTALDHFIKKGTAAPVEEEKAARQFEYLMDTLEKSGYEHYEISNFARPGFRAKHNSNYWLGAAYLGIGPSAHSFDGPSRQWNVANNQKYLKAIFDGQLPFEKEVLSLANQYNEYIMTALRTSWGVDLNHLTQWKLVDFFTDGIQKHITRGHAVRDGDCFMLTKQGRLLADGIAGDLFLED